VIGLARRAIRDVSVGRRWVGRAYFAGLAVHADVLVGVRFVVIFYKGGRRSIGWVTSIAIACGRSRVIDRNILAA
jgi:hypothetical protein